MGSKACCCATTENASIIHGQVSSQSSINASGSSSSKKKSKKPTHFTTSELEEQFAKYDIDGDGTIEMTEMSLLLEDMGVRFSMKKLKVLLQAMDKDEGGSIGQEEFIAFFANKDRSLGLGRILQDTIKEKLEEKEKSHKDFDVYIIHAMSDELGLLRCWWLASVLEFADITCTGPYVTRPPELLAAHYHEEDMIPRNVEKCCCVALILDGRYTGSANLFAWQVLEELKAAKQAEMQIVCFYEAEPETWDNLAPWRMVCPQAFLRTPVAISMRFLSDSEQLVLNAVSELLEREAQLLGVIRPPGGDTNDFRALALPHIKWLKLEFIMALRPDFTYKYVPADACRAPGTLRPVFISYLQADASQAGLSAMQKQKLLETIRKNWLEGDMDRVVFLDQVSLVTGNLLGDLALASAIAEIVSRARFIVLDHNDKGANADYFKNGKNYLEGMLAMLTGKLTPCRDGQFVELDQAIGNDLEKNINLRKYFREHANNPSSLTDSLCQVLRSKDFSNEEERQCAEAILRCTLTRHPLLVAGPNNSVHTRVTYKEPPPTEPKVEARRHSLLSLA